MSLAERIKKHEGLRLFPYEDSVGVLTIGYGHNLDQGITREIAEAIFQRDLEIAEVGASTVVGFSAMNEARQGVLIEMVFQLGTEGVHKFRRMLAAIKKRDYETASEEMLDSKWATQTPERAKTLANIMRNGE